ncbi:MAG: hypothetical protein M3478_03790 [Planctomycetota bacterium]|nr:hypothetical protein [Planctomycetota bacterium]
MTILLAVLVFIGNAYCACVNASAQRPELAVTAAVAIPTHPGCHGHRTAPEDQGPGEPESHSCGHCTGTVSADSSKAKTTPPPHVLSPDSFAAALSGLVTGVSPTGSTSYGHCGLSPPLPPPTLLKLGCSLIV